VTLSPTAVQAAPLLTYADGTLLRDGRPHRVLSGSLHYFRVTPGQ
jgi:beta-galactosidase